MVVVREGRRDPQGRSHRRERSVSGFVCGVDIGGTFTDCVLIGDDGRVAYGKALSSPADSFQSGFFGSIETAAEQFGLDAAVIYERMDLISHGSTVGPNLGVE